MNRAIVLAVAALAACQQSDSKDAQAPKVPDQTALRVSSKVDDLSIVPTSTLPANPKWTPVDEYCSAYAVASPKSPGGRLAASNGWIVTSETKLGNYDTVTFVGALDPATSATCAHLDGNLAVFDGPRLKAIAYWRHPSKVADQAADDSLGVDQTAEDTLGVADQIDQRRIRLYYGLPSAPFADVVLRDGISIEQIAREDRVCGGAAVVPNVFGEDIRQARKKLRAYGWRPSRPTEELSGGEDADLRAEGVIEVEACSGTGYGFCKYNYVHSKGFGLEVISAGEEQRVSSYQAYCSPAKN